MDGISSRHDSHQVAQKFRNTTLPRKSLSEIFLPLGLRSVKSGASRRSFISWSLGTALKSADAASPRSGAALKTKAASRITSRPPDQIVGTWILLELFDLRDERFVLDQRLLGRQHLLVADDALLVDDEIRALRQPALGVEHAVRLARLAVRKIGDQREVEL